MIFLNINHEVIRFNEKKQYFLNQKPHLSTEDFTSDRLHLNFLWVKKEKYRIFVEL